MLDHMVVLILSFCKLFSVIAVPIYVSTNSAQRYTFVHILTDNFFFHFINSHCDMCEAISHCGFNLHCPGD